MKFSPDIQWDQERHAFELFARAAGLGLRTQSIRRGDGYDIACVLADGTPLAFELSEIVDQQWATNVQARMIAPTTLLGERLYKGNDRNATEVRAKYAGWDINVTLLGRAGTRQLRPLIDSLFAWLASFNPEAINETRMPESLSRVIAHVKVQRIGNLPAMIYSPGEAIWLSDPTVATIAAKFDKAYPAGMGLQLLAYFYMQPHSPAAAESARAFLKAEMPHNVFSAVWIYSAHSDSILLRYPEVSITCL